MRRRRARFWRWFRALPIASMALMLVISAVFAALPSSLVRSVFYPVDHADAIQASATRHGVDPYLVCAVIKCESNWNESASSSAGAQGLMQLMPSTAAEVADMGLVDDATYSAANLADPVTNIEYGCAYLAYLQANLDTMDEVVAAYNAGLGQVEEWEAGGASFPDAISYPETRIYLERVNEAYARYKELYPNGVTSA